MGLNSVNKNNSANISGEKNAMKLSPWDRERKRSNCGNLIPYLTRDRPLQLKNRERSFGWSVNVLLRKCVDFSAFFP